MSPQSTRKLLRRRARALRHRVRNLRIAADELEAIAAEIEAAAKGDDQVEKPPADEGKADA